MLPRKIRDFIMNPAWGRQNGWFKMGKLNVYLRHGAHCLDGIAYPHCLDVASLVTEEQGKGNCTRFLTELERFMDEKQPGIPIFVENVLETRFQGFFLRRPNYKQCNAPDVCFIRYGRQALDIGSRLNLRLEKVVRPYEPEGISQDSG